MIWTPGFTLEALEKMAIQQALAFYKGNKTTTANSLGCAIRTLDAKIAKYAEEDKERGRREDERQIKEKEFNERQRGFNAPPARFHMEPATEIQPEQSLSVQKRLEIQEMPLTESTESGKRRAGKRLSSENGSV